MKWTPKIAYIVGLITTDGCLSKDKRHIDFTSKDLQLIKTFRRCLSLNNKIGIKYGSYTDKKIYRLQFSDTKFYKWLLSIGLMPNKTSRLKKLRIPQVYFRDFLRGHLDGDGSIITYKDNYMIYKNKRYSYQRLYLTFYSSSPRHLSWIRNNLNRIFKIKGSFLGWQRKNRKVKLWKLKFAKNDSLRLLAWLYYNPDLPCLNRKRKIAERIFKSYNN